MIEVQANGKTDDFPQFVIDCSCLSLREQIPAVPLYNHHTILEAALDSERYFYIARMLLKTSIIYLVIIDEVIVKIMDNKLRDLIGFFLSCLILYILLIIIDFNSYLA